MHNNITCYLFSVDEIERTVFDYGHTNDQPLGMNEDDERENDAVEGETNSLRKAWLKNSGGSRHSQERVCLFIL